MLGIYIHIPFCKQRCAYCDFCSTSQYSEKLMDRYAQALTAQFDDFFIKGGRYEADTLYFGGGTPSVWGAKRIANVIKELQKRVQFTRPEITVEVNPESCDKKLFKALCAAGVNRISMGVQSADDAELKALGRLHNYAQAVEAAALCRQYCTDNLSVDLMYGLPGQTMDGLRASLEGMLALEPSHISCYALKVEDGTPLARQNPVLPDDDTQADMYLYLVDALREHGFIQYEISNFARDGRVSRHNSKYWDLSEYLGFGCGAHSFYGGKRFSFTRDINGFVEGALGKQPIVEEADELSFGNRSGEYVMLKLRTAEGIDEDVFYRRFEADFAPYAARLDKYRASGHVVCENGVWRLTPKGFLVSNAIIGDALEGACPSE